MLGRGDQRYAACLYKIDMTETLNLVTHQIPESTGDLELGDTLDSREHCGALEGVPEPHLHHFLYLTLGHTSPYLA